MTTKAATPRADPITPQASFVLPTVGLDRDVWGDLTNQNWNNADTWIGNLNAATLALRSDLNALMASLRNAIEPIGSMKIWPGPPPTIPSGWLPCDGFAMGRADYAQLFAVIGGTWGAGDGTTTFNLPNLQGTVVGHRGAGWLAFGSILGETSHTLVPAEMPLHGHLGTTDNQGAHSHGYVAAQFGGAPNVQAGFSGALQQVSSQTDNTGLHNHSFATGGAGADYPHNNIQPTAGLLVIIKCVNTI
jgi:microcystin-dependent protein